MVRDRTKNAASQTATSGNSTASARRQIGSGRGDIVCTLVGFFSEFDESPRTPARAGCTYLTTALQQLDLLGPGQAHALPETARAKMPFTPPAIRYSTRRR
jgi:hypothetical protein